MAADSGSSSFSGSSSSRPVLDLRRWKHAQHATVNLDEFALPDDLTPGMKKQYGQADFRSAHVFRAVREGRWRFAFDSKETALPAFCSVLQDRFQVQKFETCEALWESSLAAAIWVRETTPASLRAPPASSAPAAMAKQATPPVIFAAHLPKR